MSGTTRTRFLILSDTHAHPPPDASTDHAYRLPLPEVDVVIHSGDLTMTGRVEEHQNAIALLRLVKAEVKIVIPGNHDLTLDDHYYTNTAVPHGYRRGKYGDTQLKQIRDMYEGQSAQDHGIHYLEEGTRTFQLKNGTKFNVYASAYTPEFCEWAFAYPHSTDRYNPPGAENPVPTFDLEAESENIDILITHGPPLGILDLTSRNMHVGCPHLLNAVARSRPLLHCFGHIHEAWGGIRRSWEGYTPPLTSMAEVDPVANTKREAQLEKLKREQLEDQTRNNTCNEDVVEVGRKMMAADNGIFYDATGLVKGKETLFVNASIMDLGYRPTQAPWVVDLML